MPNKINSLHRSVKVAIVVHAFYPEIFDEIIKFCGSMDFEYKFFVTTIPIHEQHVHDSLQKSEREFSLRLVENRGRDVLPFLKIYPQVRSEGFEVIIKLHTKKSPHLKKGEAWRQDILEKLMSPAAQSGALNVFAKDPSLGVICPDGYYVPLSSYMGANEGRVLAIASRLGLAEADVVKQGFCAGTMFMARVDTLEPLMGLTFADEEFEPEAGQVDGTMGHALERCMTFGALLKFQRVSFSSSPEVLATMGRDLVFFHLTRSRRAGLRSLLPLQVREAGRRFERVVRNLVRGKKADTRT